VWWQVVVAVLATLRASWVGSGGTPTVQLGGRINDLVIRAYNASNEVSNDLQGRSSSAAAAGSTHRCGVGDVAASCCGFSS
jgi:hypothetical protein